MTGGSALTQFFPDMAERLERLVCICCANGDNLCALQTWEVCDDGQTELLCGLIDKNEEPVVPAFGDGLDKRLLQIFCDDYLLWGHIIYGCL